MPIASKARARNTPILSGGRTVPLSPMLADNERFYVFNQLSNRMSQLDLTPLLVSLIDTVPSSILSHLAEQLRIVDYNQWQLIGKQHPRMLTGNDRRRRRLLKTAISLHRSKGTCGALLTALSWGDSLFDFFSSAVHEWFEYGGAPYHFKVDVDTENGITPPLFDMLLTLIQENKNVRSHLEMLKLTQRQRSMLPRFAIATLCGETITVYPRSQRSSDKAFDYPCLQNSNDIKI